jgi:hypothetical protein
MLPFLDTIVALSSQGMFESFWEPHLKNSETAATQMQVAVGFSLFGAGYLASAILSGLVGEFKFMYGKQHPCFFCLFLQIASKLTYPDSHDNSWPFLDCLLISVYWSCAIHEVASHQLHWSFICGCGNYRIWYQPCYGVNICKSVQRGHVTKLL